MSQEQEADKVGLVYTALFSMTPTKRYFLQGDHSSIHNMHITNINNWGSIY